MNKNSTIFVGALIGAGIGYLMADWYIETYIPEEEFELTDTPLDPAAFGDRFVIKEPTKKKVKEVSKPKNYTEFFQAHERPDLAALAAKYSGAEVEPISEDIEIEGLAENGLLSDIDEVDDPTEEMDDDGNDPGIINVHVYANDTEFTHVTLKYYNDDVLVNESGIPINHPERFLPDNALTSFGEMSQDDDIVYVRNKTKRAMYEIVRLDQAYATETSGRTRRVNKKEMGNVEGEDN